MLLVIYQEAEEITKSKPRKSKLSQIRGVKNLKGENKLPRLKKPLAQEVRTFLFLKARPAVESETLKAV